MKTIEIQQKLTKARSSASQQAAISPTSGLTGILSPGDTTVGSRHRKQSTNTRPAAVHNHTAILESLEINYERTKETRSRNGAEKRICILEILRVEALPEACVDG